MPKGWTPNKGTDSHDVQVSPYSPDRGTLPAGWIYSNQTSNSSYNNNSVQNNSKTKTKIKKGKPSSRRNKAIGTIVAFIIFISILTAIGSYSNKETSTPETQTVTQPDIQTNMQMDTQSASQNCDASYPGVCISPPPPDLDCGDIPYNDFMVTGSDPHGFDREGDGVGCET
jgi:hypothetical protein